MDRLNLYMSKDVRALDRTLIDDLGIAGYELMERAGAAAYSVLHESWPDPRKIVVVCGCGNNAGDGYIVARLAHQAGYDVKALGLIDFTKLQGDALKAARAAADAGVALINCGEGVAHDLLNTADVIVDGLFGTGLDRVLDGKWFDVVQTMNASSRPILALDIPSGLNADTGSVWGLAVKAEHTVTFIGRKQGLYTGLGRQYCGQVHFASLEAPVQAYHKVTPTAYLSDYASLAKTAMPPRSACAHKGQQGHVLLIGGGEGMSGALRLAGEAALRSGAGLVSLATRASHAALLSVARPELMSHGVEGIHALKPLLDKASVVAIGPGLGKSEWAQQMFNAVLDIGQTLVVDADALNLLAISPHHRDNWVLTPHPGEAARLLQTSVADVEGNRFEAIREIQKRYGGCVVLKGAGSLILDRDMSIAICQDGNPGMAVAGMGDVLTGTLASVLAQPVRDDLALTYAVCLHSAAADRAAQSAPRGLVASDLFPHLRNLVNP